MHDPDAFRRRFWLTFALSIPVVLTSSMVMDWFGYSIGGVGWVPPVLGTVVFFWGGWPFLSGGAHELRHRAPGMMLLIAMAITVAWVASLASSLGWADLDVWWELAALIVRKCAERPRTHFCFGPGSGMSSVRCSDREPPVPYTVTVAEAAPPPVAEVPAPAPQPQSVPPPVPVIVDQVQVVEEHKGVETRKQVAANGRTIETVPMQPAPAPAPAPPPPRPTANSQRPTPSGNYVVQVGAFADANNAALLQQRLKSAGFDSFIDKGPVLSKVQLGPFETRDEAVKTRARLEAAGLSAIIITSAQTR